LEEALRRLEVAAGYVAAIYRAPVPDELAGRISHLLGHKGEPWLTDIRARLAADHLDLFGVATHEGHPVAHAWLGSSRRNPEIGLIGHVYTMEQHRRRGLAAALLEGLLAAFDEWGGRWLTLGTNNPAAVRIYERLGFRTVNSGAHGSVIMLRSAEYGAELDAAYRECSGRWAVELYERQHYAGLCMLLSAWPQPEKMPLLRIHSGIEAEHELIEAYLAQERGEQRCCALLDAQNLRPHGMACLKGGTLEVYAPNAAPDTLDTLIGRALQVLR